MVQSFEWAALNKYLELTDYPLVMLIGVDHSPFSEKAYDWIMGKFFLVPYKTWDLIPDWVEVSQKVSGVGPDPQWVTKPGSLNDWMTDDWPKLLAPRKYAEFCNYMAILDIAVHPWQL